MKTNLENPDRVSPKERTLDVKGQQFTYELPAYSLNILRLDVRDVEIVAEEKAELPEPLVQYSFDGGQEADDEGKFPGKLHGGAASWRWTTETRHFIPAVTEGKVFLI